jgi:hypothetical protein
MKVQENRETEKMEAEFSFEIFVPSYRNTRIPYSLVSIVQSFLNGTTHTPVDKRMVARWYAKKFNNFFS